MQSRIHLFSDSYWNKSSKYLCPTSEVEHLYFEGKVVCYDANMKAGWTVPMAIFVGGMIVATALYVSMPKSSTTDGVRPELVRPVDATDHIFGNPDARVKILVYADLDCDYCRAYEDTLNQIIATEGTKGEVALVFRHFPLIEIHPNAFKHAEAAECAAKVGGADAFFVYVDMLYKNQPVEPTQYSLIAQTLGIPTDAFSACYAHAKATFTERITADRQNALDMGATGTPYTLIMVEGKPPSILPGARPYDALKAVVDDALRT